MPKRKHCIWIGVAIVLIGGIAVGGIVLRRRQVARHIGQTCLQLSAIAWDLNMTNLRATQAAQQPAQQEQAERTAAYFGIMRRHGPDNPVVSGSAVMDSLFDQMHEATKQYAEQIRRIDASRCPDGFRQVLDRHVEAVRAHYIEGAGAWEDIRPAGDQLVEVARAYGHHVTLPLGHTEQRP